MKIGYARVSTDDQYLALQLDALRAAGCEKIHEDKASGVLNGRKGLAEALKGCAAGDVLVVWKLDRLARSLHDLVVIAEDPEGAERRPQGADRERGLSIRRIRKAGCVFGILAVTAEFERELMSASGHRRVSTSGNAQHAAAEATVLLPVKWERRTRRPETGVRPQGSINRQVVANSDLLVGMFWTKLGTNTGVAE